MTWAESIRFGLLLEARFGESPQQRPSRINPRLNHLAETASSARGPKHQPRPTSVAAPPPCRVTLLGCLHFGLGRVSFALRGPRLHCSSWADASLARDTRSLVPSYKPRRSSRIIMHGRDAHARVCASALASSLVSLTHVIGLGPLASHAWLWGPMEALALCPHACIG